MDDPKTVPPSAVVVEQKVGLPDAKPEDWRWVEVARRDYDSIPPFWINPGPRRLAIKVARASAGVGDNDNYRIRLIRTDTGRQLWPL